MIPDDLIAYVEVQQLHAEVARVLDAGEFARWPEFFTEDGRYVVQSRENHERGWPLALIHLESRAMLKDRAVGGVLAQHAGPGGVFAFGAVVAVVWLLVAASMRPPLQTISRESATASRSMTSPGVADVYMRRSELR